MTKRKSTAVKDTVGAAGNRLAIGDLLTPRPGPVEPPAYFDNFGPDDIQLIKRLEELGWWGYLEKGEPGETRGIEVR